MQPAKVDVLIALFAYSGNGGVASTVPEIAFWMATNVHKMKADPRIGRVGMLKLCDTPVTMTRNQAVVAACDGGFDFLLMLDSDNEPDGYVGRDANAKPFWEVAFNHAYDRLMHGKQTIIAAPYCGPPPRPDQSDGGEVPYLFQWENNESDVPEPGYKLRLISRHEAALMRGIHRVAALPTGVCLMSIGVIEGMKKPWFYYEMDDEHAHKNSTEDVVFTRNASLRWQEKTGENILFATCDSWALHHKVKAVGRPSVMPVESVADDFREAVLSGVNAGDAIIDVNPNMRGSNIPESIPATAVQSPTPDDAAFTPSWETVEKDLREIIADAERGCPQEIADMAEVADTPPAAEPGTPTIVRRIGNRMLMTDERRPMTLEQVQAIQAVMNHDLDNRGRIVCLWSRLGDAMSTILGCLEAGALYATLDEVTDKDSCKSNCNSAYPGDVYFHWLADTDVASRIDKQDLDMVWFGYPPDETAMLKAFTQWWPHLRPGGVFAGIGATTDAAVTDALDTVVKQTQHDLELLGESSVWMIRKLNATP